MRFQRRIKLLPGLRLSLSKSGVGLSAGVRGLRAGMDARGRAYTNVGLPGTGISSRHYFQKSKQAGVPPPIPGSSAALQHTGRLSPAAFLGIAVITAASIVGVICLLIYLSV
jgi:hypothetical protein